MFQFLNGAIVRQDSFLMPMCMVWFQFLNGAIVRNNTSNEIHHIIMFQFLNGAIVRIIFNAIANLFVGFNS